jgi:hypothetical protein
VLRLNVLNQVEDQAMATWTRSAGDNDGLVEVFYRLRGGGRVVDGFENARVGVESVEVIDIVGSREPAVTISDKFVKTGSLFWGEREGCAAKVAEGCERVNKRQTHEEKGRPLELSDWSEPTSSSSMATCDS